jgi:hypothetical protein
MEELKEKAKDLVDHAEDYAETFYRLALVNATQKVANIGSGIVLAIILAVTTVFALLFASFALAWWLGNVLDSRAGGFLLTAGIFLFIGGILLLLRKNKILPLMRDVIVRKFYD